MFLKILAFFVYLFSIGGWTLTMAAPPTRQVTDQIGRTVTIPANPRKVVAFAASITEIIYALDRQERLVGVTEFSDYPPAATKLPKVGSYVRLDLERIVALQPDLCIATKDGNPKATVDRLTHLGIPVFVVDPRDFDSIMKTVKVLGSLLGADEAAGQIVEDLKKRMDQVQSTVANVSYRPRVFMQIGISPIIAVGTNTFIHDLIVMAGGRNVTSGKSTYPRLSREEVIHLAPDIIVISTMARSGAFEEVKKQWTQWQQIPAARHNRIYVVDSNLFNRPTPRLVEALELLAGIFHPELYDKVGTGK